MEALVRGTLPEAERVLAEQHIANCEGCRLELELVRAIGSQEKPATVGQADWTLDRIFGAEQQEGGQPPVAAAPGSGPAQPQGSSAPAPAAPEEDSSAMEAMDRPGSSTAPAGGAQSLGDEDSAEKGPSTWAFEPADAKADLKPPEESLFFAEEALTRRRGTKGKKGSNLRVIMWGAGGVVGAILLALSSWLVLHMAPPSEAEDPSIPSQTNEDAGTVAEDATSTEQAPDQPAAPEPAAPAPEIAAPHAGTVSPDRTGTGAGAPPVPDRKTSASSAPQPLPLPGSLSAPPRTPTPAVTKRAAPPPAKQAPGAPQPAPASGHRVVVEPSKPSAPPKAPASEGPVESEDPTAGFADDAPPEPGEEGGNSNGASGADDAAVRPAPATSWLPPAPHRSGSDSVSPRSAAAPASKAPEESAPEPPAIVRPIDRIHLATVAAEERGDLTELRRLRSTWKDFMSKMGVAPERARARREYADCLWAIQSLTGRRSDQKGALAAYRDYLLSAPAGGADSRSVSRLRQLEDALAEKR